DERARALDARGADALLVLVAPATDDRLAREVDDGVDLRELRLPRPVVRRVPTDDARASVELLVRAGRIAREGDDGVAATIEDFAHAPADEAGRTGDEDA